MCLKLIPARHVFIQYHTNISKCGTFINKKEKKEKEKNPFPFRPDQIFLCYNFLHLYKQSAAMAHFKINGFNLHSSPK